MRPAASGGAPAGGGDAGAGGPGRCAVSARLATRESRLAAVKPAVSRRVARALRRWRRGWRGCLAQVAPTAPPKINAGGVRLVVFASPKSAEVKSIDQPAKQSLNSKLLIVGDVFWGRFVQRKAELTGKGLMSGIDPADRAGYEAWIGNFECPVTYRDIPYAQQIDSLKFNCRPEYLPDLAKFFTAVSLANNHTANTDGERGLSETRSNLESAGIQYFGGYDMSKTDDICEIIAVPAKISNKASTSTIPVALCVYHQVVNIQPTDEQLMVMEQYSRYMPVIAMPHMGVEYRATAEPEKVEAYRKMIDSGASMVIGAHPHVIQNSESWHGKLIAYSVGNFLFDQQSLGRDTTVGLGVEVNLEISDDRLYREIGANCQPHKDDCLQYLAASNIPRPQITVKYGFRCFDMASGVPVAGSEAVCAAAKQKATTDNLNGLSDQI